MTQNIFITGGAGFLGSHFVERLCQLPEISKISVFDRHAERLETLQQQCEDSKINLISGDLKNLDRLTESMRGHQTIIHLASNADISKAIQTPTIDFQEGTVLTQNVLEAARINGRCRILYASGSGVYGEHGKEELREDDGPLVPISTYGASKLAGEALLSAYCHMFDLSGVAFRFANIVGPGQTHGVALDFVSKLRSNPNELQILGNGLQTKSYILVNEVFDAVWLAHSQSMKNFDVFNVASADSISVNEIAQIAIEELLPQNAKVEIKHSEKDRGWKGDVPVVRLNCDKIKALGFQSRITSRDAIRLAISGIAAKI